MWLHALQKVTIMSFSYVNDIRYRLSMHAFKYKHYIKLRKNMLS